MSCNAKATGTRGIDCSDRGGMFKVEKVVRGRKIETTECLAHATDSLERGHKVHE